MSRNPNLVATTIVDKRGRQTTVHKKPLEASLSASKAIPAPAPASTADWLRADQEVRVSSLFSPPKCVKFVQRKLPNLSDKALGLIEKCATKMNNVKLHETPTLAFIVSDIERGALPEESLPYFFRAIDSVSDECSFGDLKDLYVMVMTGNNEQSPDNVLDAHLHVAENYFQTVLENEANVPFKYTDNRVLFDLVNRFPDKADVIIRNRATYLPEINGVEAFEADLDQLSEIAKPVGEGWL